MFITLDGYTADAEGGQGRMRDQGGPGFGAFVQVLSEPQVMVMGRWPSSPVALDSVPRRTEVEGRHD